jgi:hypothetical protein
MPPTSLENADVNLNRVKGGPLSPPSPVIKVACLTSGRISNVKTTLLTGSKMHREEIE